MFGRFLGMVVVALAAAGLGQPSASAASSPTVTGLSPAAGPVSGGVTLVIRGANLNRASRVLFGAVAVSHPKVLSARQLQVRVPAHAAGTVDVRVVTAGGTSGAGKGDRFAYQAPPTVSELAPPVGPVTGGTVVTVDGENLTRASVVLFGAVAGVHLKVVSDRRVQVTAPRGVVGRVPVRVRTPGGLSEPRATVFTYRPDQAPVDNGIRLVSVDRAGHLSDGMSAGPRVSADGRYVTFFTNGGNWADGGGIYRRDMITGDLEPTSGSSTPDGHYTLSSSDHVYLRDVAAGTSAMVDVTSSGAPSQGDAKPWGVSNDGRWVLFYAKADDIVAGSSETLFLRDMLSGTTRVVVECFEAQCLGAMTPDGRRVAYSIRSADVWQVYSWDRETGVSTLVSSSPSGSAGSGESLDPSISDDGRLVAFTSSATDLVTPAVTGTHAYVRDLVAGTTVLADRSPSGAPGDGKVEDVVICGDGSRVAIISDAGNLTPATISTPFPQLYVRDLASGSTRLVSVTPYGQPGNGREDDPASTGSSSPSLSPSGEWVAFESQSTDLVLTPVGEHNIYLAHLS